MRRRVTEDGLADVLPEATYLFALNGFVPLLLQVNVPGLPSASANLQVGYFPPDWQGGDRLICEWGDSHLLDGSGHRDDLSVDGTDMTPESLAEHAFQWMRTQLIRPIDAQDWTRRGRVLATDWRFSDTGELLATDGVWLRKLRRLVPHPRHVR